MGLLAGAMLMVLRANATMLRAAGSFEHLCSEQDAVGARRGRVFLPAVFGLMVAGVFVLIGGVILALARRHSWANHVLFVVVALPSFLISASAYGLIAHILQPGRSSMDGRELPLFFGTMFVGGIVGGLGAVMLKERFTAPSLVARNAALGLAPETPTVD